VTKPEFLDQLAEVLEVEPGSLKGEEKLEDLEGWSSIAMVSFMGLADEHFSVRLSPRQFGACKDVNDLAKLVGL
jgi:acyl carrier protein